MIVKPHVDWFALAPSLALLAASGLLLMVAVFVPRRGRKPTSAFVAFAGFVASGIWAAFLDDRSPTPPRSSTTRCGATAGARSRRCILAGAGAVAVLLSYGERMRDEHVAEYYALLTAAGAGMAFFVQAGNLMTLFLGLEWFSIALYVLTAIDIDLVGSLEAGLKYLVDRRVRLGDAALRLGARLRDHRRAVVRPHRRDRARARRDARRRPRDDHRRARVQGVGGAVPHVDARRLPGRADAGDRVHGVGDEDRRARRHLPRARDRVPARPAPLARRDRRDRVRLARVGQHRRARAAEREADPRLLVRLARRLHADRRRRGEPARRAGAPLLPRPLRGDVARRVRRRRGAGARARSGP